MAIPYTKPHLSFCEQVSLLEERGMIIKDRKGIETLLANVGYYHMSAYWYPYRKENSEKKHEKEDVFIDGVAIEEIEKLMFFDKTLRSLTFDMLTDIEIAFRCRIAHEIGKNNAFAYYLGQCVEKEYQIGGAKNHLYKEWLCKLDSQIDRSKETFVSHYKSKYNQPFPVWISCELWDFGMTSKLYGMLTRKYRDIIAASLGIETSSCLRNWLHALNVVRNLCAHNARLWNRSLSTRLQFPSPSNISELAFMQIDGYDPTKIAVVLCVIVWLHRKILPKSNAYKSLYRHLQSLKSINLPELNYSCMGFQSGWERKNIWGL